VKNRAIEFITWYARGIEPLFELFLLRWFCFAKKASGESPAFPDKGRTRPPF
jgi:hypothetical protein